MKLRAQSGTPCRKLPRQWMRGERSEVLAEWRKQRAVIRRREENYAWRT